MKKKIKDLTLEEYQRICNKSDCKTCPLLHYSQGDKDSDLDCPTCYESDYMLKEVEINESNND